VTSEDANDTASLIKSGSRLNGLKAIRDRLADELSNEGHQRGCECECGPSGADGRVVASLSKELRAVLLDLESLGVRAEVSPLDHLAAAVGDELAAARTRRQSAAAGP
jgi:hypothetical protein